jgi:hypothetical protein
MGWAREGVISGNPAQNNQRSSHVPMAIHIWCRLPELIRLELSKLWMKDQIPEKRGIAWMKFIFEQELFV